MAAARRKSEKPESPAEPASRRAADLGRGISVFRNLHLTNF
jgi:hypothetical protein